MTENGSTTLMEGIMTFMDKVERECHRLGESPPVQKATIRGAGSSSPYSLYNESIASFTTG